jgi:hypothetical protein
VTGQRVLEHTEARQHAHPESLGGHQLAHLRTVGGVGDLGQAVAEQTVDVAVHQVARAHQDHRLRQQRLDADGVQPGQWVLRGEHHHRASPQQQGALEIRRCVVALQAGQQAEVEGPLAQLGLDRRTLGPDDLDLGFGMGVAEGAHHLGQQRHRGGVDRADPDHASGPMLGVGHPAEVID